MNPPNNALKATAEIETKKVYFAGEVIPAKISPNPNTADIIAMISPAIAILSKYIFKKL